MRKKKKNMHIDGRSKQGLRKKKKKREHSATDLDQRHFFFFCVCMCYFDGRRGSRNSGAVIVNRDALRVQNRSFPQVL